MEGVIALLQCEVCHETFYEEIDECKMIQSGVCSVEWRRLRHHGSMLSLTGFATAARYDFNKPKDSSTRSGWL